MKRHTLLVGALAATFVTGCASLDDKRTPELFEPGTQTGTNIDRPGLPPKTTDQYSLERVFRNSGSSMVADPNPQ
jgi:hypothetical protein